MCDDASKAYNGGASPRGRGRSDLDQPSGGRRSGMAKEGSLSFPAHQTSFPVDCMTFCAFHSAFPVWYEPVSPENATRWRHQVPFPLHRRTRRPRRQAFPAGNGDRGGGNGAAREAFQIHLRSREPFIAGNLSRGLGNALSFPHGVAFPRRGKAQGAGNGGGWRRHSVRKVGNARRTARPGGPPGGHRLSKSPAPLEVEPRSRGGGILLSTEDPSPAFSLKAEKPPATFCPSDP
jgi:hypothetical protein